jgi:acyl carrier protein
MGSRLSAVDVRRMAGMGIGALEPGEALEAFDAALAADVPLLAPVRLDGAALRTIDPARLPAALRALAPARRPAPERAAERTGPGAAPEPGGGLPARLAALHGEGRRAVLLELVRRHLGEALGHADPEAVPTDRGFLDLGLDSLTAVELRNRLSADLALRLPSTLLFDHPTALALAAELETLLPAPAPTVPERRGGPLDPEALTEALARLDPAGTPVDALDRITAGLRDALERLQAALPGGPGGAFGARLDSADDDELFDLIDEQLGGDPR